MIIRGYDGNTDRGSIKLWDIAKAEAIYDVSVRDSDQEPRASIPGGRADPYAERGADALSPDGMLRAYSEITYNRNDEKGPTTTLVVWNLKENKEVKKIKVGDESEERRWSGMATAPMFTPDGKQLIWGDSDGTIRLFDIGTGKEIRQLGEAKGSGRRGEMQITSPESFSPDGKTLLALRFDGTYWLYELESGKELRQIGDTPPRDAEEERFGRRRRSIRHRARRVYDGEESYVSSLTWAPDGKTLAQSSGNMVRLWSAESGKALNDSAGHVGGVSEVLAAADGKSALTLGSDNSVRKWNVDTSKELQKYDLGADVVRSVLIGPSRVLTFKSDGSAMVWDPVQREEVCSLWKKDEDRYNSFDGEYAEQIRIVRDQKIVAITSAQVLVHILNLESGKEVGTLLTKKDFSIKGLRIDEPIRGIACSSDGGLVAVRADIGGHRWREYDEPEAQVKAVVRVYDSKTGREIWEAPAKSHGCHDLVFSPNGRSIALIEGSGDAVALYETATGKERWRVQAVGDIGRFSDDGLFFALGTQHGAVKVLDARDGNEIASFQGHLGRVTCLSFDADASMLMSGGMDSTVLTWDTSAQVAKARPRPELGPEQAKTSWADLAGSDGAVAYQAVLALSASPKQATALLKEQLKPVKVVEEEQLDKLIAQLDHDDFDTRERAFHELARIGDRARDALNEALEKDTSQETRKYVEQLLRGLDPGTPLPEVLRPLRAIEVLETIGTPEARAILESLAKGARGNRLTREAALAVKRMGK